MPISISSQANVFLWSIIGGMLIGLAYDVFRIKRKAIRTGSFLVYIEDLTYWIIAALIMFFIVYYSNDGEVRGYIFIGTIIGVILYALLLSKIIMKSSLFIIRLVYKLIKTIFDVLTYPIRVIIKILAVPAGFLIKLSKKSLKRARGISRIRFAKAAMWRKTLKNKRKKI